MSVYEVDEFCHRLSADPAYRELARADLPAALRGFDLTAAEHAAIVGGDVALLLSQGVHPLLLVRLSRYGIAGLTEQTYSERMRQRFGTGE